MKEYFVIQHFSECMELNNDKPELLCAVPSQADAEEMILAFYEGAPYESYLECLQLEGLSVEDFFDGSYFKYDYFYEKVNIIE